MKNLAISELGMVFQIQRLSTEDGPGIRTTVFLKQCPLRCVWCHNPESISRIPQLEWFKHKCIGCRTCIKTCKYGALSFEEDGLHIDREKCNSCSECAEECPSTALNMLGKLWRVEDLFHEVEKDKVYYTKSGGGITVSGGEPTMQPDFVLNFLKKCKNNDISTALDTCGIATKEVYRTLLPYVDLVLLDIKEIDPIRHKEFTGVSNERILANAVWISNYIKKSNKKLWIRTPIIPKFNATKENIKGIGEFIVKQLNNIPDRWDLLSFNSLCADKYDRLDMSWVLKDEPLMTREEIERFYEIAKATDVRNVQWSGLTRKTENISEAD